MTGSTYAPVQHTADADNNLAAVKNIDWHNLYVGETTNSLHDREREKERKIIITAISQQCRIATTDVVTRDDRSQSDTPRDGNSENHTRRFLRTLFCTLYSSATVQNGLSTHSVGVKYWQKNTARHRPTEMDCRCLSHNLTLTLATGYMMGEITPLSESDR